MVDSNDNNIINNDNLRNNSGSNGRTHNKNSRLEKPKHKWEKYWHERTLVRIESEIIKKGIPIPHTFLTLEELLAPCKQSRARKTIQRPQNDYVIYRKEVSAELSNNYPNTHFQDVSRIASQRWNNEAQEKRNFFTILAFVGNLIHADVFPDYQYKPNSKKRNLKNKSSEEKEEKPWEKAASQPQKQEKNEEHGILSSKSSPSSSSSSSSTRASAFRLVKQESSTTTTSSFLRKPPPSFTPYPVVRKIPVKVISTCASSSNDIKSLNENSSITATSSTSSCGCNDAYVPECAHGIFAFERALGSYETMSERTFGRLLFAGRNITLKLARDYDDDSNVFYEEKGISPLRIASMLDGSSQQKHDLQKFERVGHGSRLYTHPRQPGTIGTETRVNERDKIIYYKQTKLKSLMAMTGLVTLSSGLQQVQKFQILRMKAIEFDK
ncbi:3549_t:CDS:2 [Ambispora leptoticha]|uniref:3549_t:CDS:1 n=1 Tax=Ambispora leptoticha TaxID=144679 RepID=A0A9N9EZ36_9GLOM|nr:3549_t:CDS:2 [Ambispora leptoticha]